MKIWRMRIACWIRKAIDTHSEYVILIAFPLQQWLHKALHCYVIHTLPVLSLVSTDNKVTFINDPYLVCPGHGLNTQFVKKPHSLLTSAGLFLCFAVKIG